MSHMNVKSFTNSSECCVFGFLTWCHRNWITIAERISGVSVEAGTYRYVIEHCALSIGTTRTWTRVSALFSHASLTRGTIGVDRTFWSTVWWTANVS